MNSWVVCKSQLHLCITKCALKYAPQLYMGIGASGTPYLYVTLSFIDNFL